MSDDIFDIVNECDEVVGSAPRSIVHARGLLHRAAHVIIFRGSGEGREILLQKRSMSKDSYPGIYTTSCSGHVDSGETYDIAAVREMREETGLSVKISDLRETGKISARAETGNEFTFVYELECPKDAKFSPPPDEVASLDWMRVADFEAEIKASPQKFTPSFLCVYAFYKASARGLLL